MGPAPNLQTSLRDRLIGEEKPRGPCQSGEGDVGAGPATCNGCTSRSGERLVFGAGLDPVQENVHVYMYVYICF